MLPNYKLDGQARQHAAGLILRRQSSGVIKPSSDPAVVILWMGFPLYSRHDTMHSNISQGC